MQTEEYKVIPIEQYLKIAAIKELDSEIKEEIRRVRSTHTYMSPEQFKFLKEQGIITRTRKLRTPRTLWVDEESGKIFYFCHFGKKFQWCGYFNNEEE